MADPPTPLAAAMLELAAAGHPLGVRLRLLAEELEVARRIYHAAPAPFDGEPLWRFTAAFSRAWQLWERCDGRRVMVDG